MLCDPGLQNSFRNDSYRINAFLRDFFFIRTFNTLSPALYLPTYTNLHVTFGLAE